MVNNQFWFTYPPSTRLVPYPANCWLQTYICDLTGCWKQGAESIASSIYWPNAVRPKGQQPAKSDQ